MKVAYIFATNMASTFKLNTMILPQLERGIHGAEVVGMFFFDDNLLCLRARDPMGEKLAAVALRQNFTLMICDQCAMRRDLAEGTLDCCGKGDVVAKGVVPGVVAGCFPQFYETLAPRAPDHVITL
jgi:hypothetical protein